MSCPVSGATAIATPQTNGAPTCPFAGIANTKPSKNPQLVVPEAYRTTDLTPAEKDLVKASIPALQAHGVDITKLFYTNLLIATPALKDIFNASNQAHFEQPRALANAVLAYAQNIDDPSPILPTVQLVVSKHISLGVQAEQYAVVGKYLIEAIAEVLGEAITPELGAAWTHAYWKLAQLFITLEDEAYRSMDGWTEWREFRIAKKVKESEEVTSFYLEPVEEELKPLKAFLPGQFISIQVDVPELGHKQARQYSLSDSPNPNYYRISIKKETGSNGVAPPGAPGVISTLMHETKNEGDIIRVTKPAGTFFLDQTSSTAPLVLISGGVGLTPLTSMLNTLAGQNSTKPISWVHGARSEAVRPFKQHVEGVAKTHSSVQVTLFTNQIATEELDENHLQGYINLEKLDKEKKLFLNDKQTQYYICGPMVFMIAIEKALKEQGVDASRIHVEKFGTGGVPSA